MKNIAQQILIKIIKAKPKSYDQFLKLKRQFSAEFNLPPVSNATLIKAYRQLCSGKRWPDSGSRWPRHRLLKFLTKRKTRTLSGVTPITVLTKPYPCPGKCIYCPDEPGMPKSYLSNEPAAQRAKLNKFDPAKQVKMRIKALEANGHQVDKIELLILGGCFNAYSRAYQKNFIKKCFDACNYPKMFSGGFTLRNTRTLDDAFQKNESAKYRIIGITVETRPDLINEKEIKWFRDLGITRVQLGIQHLDAQILKLIERGHTVEQTIKATRLLKQAGFKIDYHLMPDLPGSTPKKDLAMFKKIFSDENFQPDQIKIYPTVVNQYALLYHWYKSRKYKPYSPKQLLNLLIKIKQLIPYYVRLNRLVRDIPQESIIAGNKITNLRELLQQEMKKRCLTCHCIRCREARENVDDIKKAKLFTQKYRASDGLEYFISYESPKRDKLYSFLRLRINDANRLAASLVAAIPELNNAALIRELHTYGQLVPTHRSVDGKLRSGGGMQGIPPAVQHTGFGKRLMKIAEDMTLKHGLKKIAVIAGIGVRPYYRKLGYRLQGTYMLKYLR